MSHFIPCTKESDAKQTAQTFIDRVFWLHGLPENIISDRDVRFNSEFWEELWSQLKVEQKMSTGFHPQTDGQTERVNQYVNQYLRIYTTYLQDNWIPLLPLADVRS
ncbi:MAG: hypothetical protein EOP45_13410, partial [Sphingobacteriaceae bacterium]